MIWCSVDPGSCGAIVVWEDDKPINLYRLEQEVGAQKEWKHLSIEILNCNACYVEKVRGMFWDGAASAFNFGWNCGMLHQFFKGEVEYISPQKWMNTMHAGLPKATPTKERSFIVAKKLYGDFLEKHKALRKKDDGVWDALLIGHYVLWTKRIEAGLEGRVTWTSTVNKTEK